MTERTPVKRCPKTIAGIRIARMIEREPDLSTLEISERTGASLGYAERMIYWHEAAIDAVARYERRAAKSKVAQPAKRHPLLRVRRRAA